MPQLHCCKMKFASLPLKPDSNLGGGGGGEANPAGSTTLCRKFLSLLLLYEMTVWLISCMNFGAHYTAMRATIERGSWCFSHSALLQYGMKTLFIIKSGWFVLSVQNAAPRIYLLMGPGLESKVCLGMSSEFLDIFLLCGRSPCHIPGCWEQALGLGLDAWLPPFP